MVATSRVAVVIHNRDARRNIIVQTSGIEPRNAAQAVLDAVLRLDQISLTNDPGDIQSCVQGLPMGCGSIRLWQNKWQAFYRNLGGVIPFVLVPVGTNSFMALDLLGQVAQVLLSGETRGGDLAPERVERRYPEIYLALDSLLHSGATKTGRQALEESRHTLDVHVKGSSKSVAARSSVSAPTVKARKRRTLKSQGDMFAGMAFSTDAALMGVKPPPAFQLKGHEAVPTSSSFSSRTAVAAAPVAGPAGPADPFAASGGDLLSSLLGAGATAAAAGTAHRSATPVKGDPFSDILPSNTAAGAAKPGQAGSEGWTAFDSPGGAAAPAVAPRAATAVGVAAVAAAAPVPKPSRELLRLKEVWRAEVVGSQVKRGGLDGRVTWLEDASKEQATIPIAFALEPPLTASDALKSSLASARRNAMAVQQDSQREGMFVVDGQSAKFIPPPPLLTYHLAPAAAPPLPLKLQLSYSSEAMPDGQKLVTFWVAVLSSPPSHVQCSGDLVVDLTLPSLFEKPARASAASSHVAEYHELTRTVRWVLPVGSSPGSTDTLTAVYIVSAGTHATEVAAAQAVAKGTLKGDAGATLTGVCLFQDIALAAPSSLNLSWEAIVTATPPRMK